MIFFLAKGRVFPPMPSCPALLAFLLALELQAIFTRLLSFSALAFFTSTEIFDDFSRHFFHFSIPKSPSS
jgi:hypothetical protein